MSGSAVNARTVRFAAIPQSACAESLGTLTHLADAIINTLVNGSSRIRDFTAARRGKNERTIENRLAGELRSIFIGL